MPVAIISGISGQDGSYLAELLLEKGYEVHGFIRPTSSLANIRNLTGDGASLSLHKVDLSDSDALAELFSKIQPDEFYHLAAQSSVALSFAEPQTTLADVAGVTLNLLETCRKLEKPPRFFNATSSEVYGVPAKTPQTEATPFRPVNPYGCAKAFATNLCCVYRECHRLFVVNGILYNHESPRRGEAFVTRKIASAAARIANGSGEILELGNLDSERDWGWAPEFVEAMWKTLQYPSSADYILATGTSTTVRAFARAAFGQAGIQLEFSGTGTNETAFDTSNGKTVLRVNPEFFRPIDSHRLIGKHTHAQNTLGWFPDIVGTEVALALTSAETSLIRKQDHP